jgi:RecA-family ATPase
VRPGPHDRRTAPVSCEHQPLDAKFRRHIDPGADPEHWGCDAPPVEWVVEDVLPVGCVTLLTGAPDAGKTWWALALSKALLQSNTFLGRRISRRRKIIYVDQENPLSIVKQRLEELAFEPSVDFHFWSFHCAIAPPQLTDAETYAQLAKSIVPRPVFIFDSLVRFHGAANENSASDMAVVMAQLRLIANTGAAVLVLHHKGKSENNQYRGSSDIQAGVDE